MSSCRIQSVFDNGHEKTYRYDDQGQRAIKRGPQGETVYVNQFFTDRPGANGTKHIYAGTTRIASKLMRQDTQGANPNGKTPFEKDLYFYHPDHLGSSNYITDLNGKLYEHLEYFPFGEGWIEENTNQQRTPYLFSAKELDEETGLYYFEARYYDPRSSIWQSADPILSQYLPKAPTKPEDVIKLLPPTVQNPMAQFDLPGIGGGPQSQKFSALYVCSRESVENHGPLGHRRFRFTLIGHPRRRYRTDRPWCKWISGRRSIHGQEGVPTHCGRV